MLNFTQSSYALKQADTKIPRTRFKIPHTHKTTLSAGLLYPLYWTEILPGDTFEASLSSVLRMSTPIHPVMDNAYFDVFWFFCPNRILFDHFKSFMGESSEDPYINPIEYQIPQLKNAAVSDANAPGVPPKSILDYLGVPSMSCPKEFQALPVRAYCKVWNEWFRDQNLQNAIDLDTGDNNLIYAGTYYDGVNTATPNIWWDNNNATDPDSYVLNAAHGGDLAPVNRYHDYFSSCLIAPQKGDAVPIPLSGMAPVYANSLINIEDLASTVEINREYVNVVDDTGSPIFNSLLGTDQGGKLSSDVTSFQPSEFAMFNNLGADLSNVAGMYATINDLRYAFQMQRFLSRDNYGTRYREVLLNHFQTVSPDASQQIPEFLGANRQMINMQQSVQTSATNDVSPQGNVAAYSLTANKEKGFLHSFSEHGILLCVGCVRTDHTYSQGMDKSWFRKSKFDYYWPEFAHISDMPVPNKCIFNGWSKGSTENGALADWDVAEEIFGYNVAWQEYRVKPNRCSGEFATQYPQSLDVWHYGDKYLRQPYLSSEWIRETRANIDRTLAVSSDVADQFICDLYFDIYATRPMPVTSNGGYADHF